MLISRLLLVLMAALASSCLAVVNPTSENQKLTVTKYFWEPGKGDLSGHYDVRFFREVVNYDTRVETLRHLARAWLKMTADEGIETWIAHGTLLGWWWNEKMLPWDWDLDVQVSVETLNTLASKYNMTQYDYQLDNVQIRKKYLLDVNPWIWERTDGDRQNVIDARWIDMQNGLYIDITGLAAADPKNPDVLNCKNWHRYSTSDIWPLRGSTFEGVPVKVPQKYDKILEEEYTTRALYAQEWDGHRWNLQTKEWEFAIDLFNDREPGSEQQLPIKYRTTTSSRRKGFLGLFR